MRTMDGQSGDKDEEMIQAACKFRERVVPEGGLEPPQGCPYRILSPARLPFHHSGTRKKPITYTCKNFKRPSCAAVLARHNTALKEQLPAFGERAYAKQFRVIDVFQLSGVA